MNRDLFEAAKSAPRCCIALRTQVTDVVLVSAKAVSTRVRMHAIHIQIMILDATCAVASV